MDKEKIVNFLMKIDIDFHVEDGASYVINHVWMDDIYRATDLTMTNNVMYSLWSEGVINHNYKAREKFIKFLAKNKMKLLFVANCFYFITEA